MDLIHPIFKWLHVIAGIMWIGLLYFFNFINTSFAPTMDGDTKKKVVPELMPRTLYWFRWGAAYTWITGIVLLYVIYWSGSEGLMPGDFTSDDVTGEPANMFIHIARVVLLSQFPRFPFHVSTGLAAAVGRGGLREATYALA